MAEQIEIIFVNRDNSSEQIALAKDIPEDPEYGENQSQFEVVGEIHGEAGPVT